MFRNVVQWRSSWFDRLSSQEIQCEVTASSSVVASFFYVGNCKGCCENLIVRHIQQLYQVCCVVIQWAGICPEWAIHTKHRCVFSCKSSWNDTILWGLATLLWCIFQLSAKQRIWLLSTNIWQVLSSGNTAMWCLWCDNVKPLMQRK